MNGKAVPLLAQKGSSESLFRASEAPSRQCSLEAPLLAPFGLLEPPTSRPTSPSVSDVPGHPHAERLLFLAEGTKHVADHVPGAPLHAFLYRLLAFTGPGWLMSIAYVDPGNLEADLQCGALFGYSLLWVLFGATSIGLCMQLVAARLGCATRRHLAEHCRDHYGLSARLVLWFLTELAIIGSDVQEVIGCAIGLQLLLGLPLAAGVIVTAVAAFGFLFLERLGTRPLELFFGALILVLALSMGGLFAVIQPDGSAMLEGLLVPRLPPSALQQAVGMVGCVIMPHNLFLHSALVQSRVVPDGDEAEAVFLFTIESTAAIFTSLLINMSVVAVFAKGFYGHPEKRQIGLRNAGTYLGDAFGAPLKVIWALGLCAAGQSSTMTGAYAGQWVMQGYLQLKVKPWKRAIITRSMALIPTLLVAVVFGGQNAGLDALNSYLNVLQSLVLPFAAVPLLTFASDRGLMGDLALTSFCRLACWVAMALVMVANMYLIVAQFTNSGSESGGGFNFQSLPVALGLCCFVTAYVAGLFYIAWVPKKMVHI